MTVQITTRRGKGAPLSSDEVDANFTNLAAAIESATGVYLEDFEVTEDGGLTLTWSDGKVIGPIPLPTKAIVGRGAWGTGIAYLAGDLYEFEGSSYYVSKDHISTTVAADRAAGKVMLNAAAGKPGEPGDGGSGDGDGGTGGGGATGAFYDTPLLLQIYQPIGSELTATLANVQASTGVTLVGQTIYASYYQGSNARVDTEHTITNADLTRTVAAFFTATVGAGRLTAEPRIGNIALTFVENTSVGGRKFELGGEVLQAFTGDPNLGIVENRFYSSGSSLDMFEFGADRALSDVLNEMRAEIDELRAKVAILEGGSPAA